MMPKPVRKIVYVAGPMALGSMAHNIRQAWAVAEALRDLGFSPIVPHDSFFGSITGTERPHEEWLDIDLPFVLASAAVLRLPGESKGADKEVAWAREVGIPVFDDPNPEASLNDLAAHFGVVQTSPSLEDLSEIMPEDPCPELGQPPYTHASARRLAKQAAVPHES